MVFSVKILVGIIIICFIALIVIIARDAKKLKNKKVAERIKSFKRKIEYYQDVDVEWIFYARYRWGIFIYRKNMGDEWELINKKGDDGDSYICETIGKRSKSDIRTEQDLINSKVKLLDRKWADEQINKYNQQI
jgi:hypothetical protein